MTKVKVFVYGRRRRQSRLQGYDKSYPDFHHGELKTRYFEYDHHIYRSVTSKPL